MMMHAKEKTEVFARAGTASGGIAETEQAHTSTPQLQESNHAAAVAVSAADVSDKADWNKIFWWVWLVSWPILAMVFGSPKVLGGFIAGSKMVDYLAGGGLAALPTYFFACWCATNRIVLRNLVNSRVFAFPVMALWHLDKGFDLWQNYGEHSGLLKLIAGFLIALGCIFALGCLYEIVTTTRALFFLLRGRRTRR